MYSKQETSNRLLNCALGSVLSFILLTEGIITSQTPKDSYYSCRQVFVKLNSQLHPACVYTPQGGYVEFYGRQSSVYCAKRAVVELGKSCKPQIFTPGPTQRANRNEQSPLCILDPLLNQRIAGRIPV